VVLFNIKMFFVKGLLYTGCSNYGAGNIHLNASRARLVQCVLSIV
jgi:hypothetical protein